MINYNFNPDEIFRLINFPTMQSYLDSISENEERAIENAEEILMNIKSIVERKLHELNFSKLRTEFKFSLETNSRDDLHDYSTPEVAKILGRSPASVRNYIKDGHLKSYRTLNGDYRITKKSIEEFLNSMKKN